MISCNIAVNHLGEEVQDVALRSESCRCRTAIKPPGHAAYYKRPCCARCSGHEREDGTAKKGRPRGPAHQDSCRTAAAARDGASAAIIKVHRSNPPSRGPCRCDQTGSARGNAFCFGDLSGG